MGTRLQGVLLGMLAGGSLLQAATRYDGDGVLSARLERERWFINRARHAPEKEADRLAMVNTMAGGHPSFDCCADVNLPNDFGAQPGEWGAWAASRGPLAPNARLSAAASKHSRDVGESGVVDHHSPSDRYYARGSSPRDRWQAEQYGNGVSGYCENIAWGYRYSSHGYPEDGLSVWNLHTGLFRDSSSPDCGHRQAILNTTAREIGLGTFRTNRLSVSGATVYYWVYDYDTQDFGNESGQHFFTGTVFWDRNYNGHYDEGEGVGGIEVRLWVGATEAPWYDVSQASGSFAVPIREIPDGSFVRVRLVNRTGAARKLTVPAGFGTLGEFFCAKDEVRTYGWFRQPGGAVNVGFRETTPFLWARMARSTTNRVSFLALKRCEYVIQSSDDAAHARWQTLATLTATWYGTRHIDDWGQGGRPPPSQAPQRAYRVLLRRD